jgi:aminoglycoside phosphotransferase (APT) family kinase protein
MSALNTIAVTSVLLGLQVAVAVADGPPKLDLAPTCDAAARFSIFGGRDKEACLEDEHTAESTLAQNWSKYNAAAELSSPCLAHSRQSRRAHDQQVRPR